MGLGAWGEPERSNYLEGAQPSPAVPVWLWTQCFQIWLLKTRQKSGFLHVHVKISLSFGNSVTKLPYHLPLPSTLPSTTHTQTENQKPLFRSHKCLWFTLNLKLPYWCLWSGPIVFYPRWGNGGPEKRSDLTKVISLDSLLQSPMKSWQIILF